VVDGIPIGQAGVGGNGREEPVADEADAGLNHLGQGYKIFY